MDNAHLKKQLMLHGQGHLVDYLESLQEEDRQTFANSLASINFALLEQQRQMILSPLEQAAAKSDPFDTCFSSGDLNCQQVGHQQIKQGKVGCIVLAGGEGSRLGFSGPKGMFPISVIRCKSLFQLLAEKVIAASKQAERLLLIAIMTSPQNDAITRQFFAENGNFGLDDTQLFFFCQRELPFLDSNANLFLDTPTSIAKGPNGNGLCFKHLIEEGI